MIRRALTFCLALVAAMGLVPAGARAQGTPAPPPTQGSGKTRCDIEASRLRLDSLPNIGQVSYAGGGVTIRCPGRGIVLKGDSAEQFNDHDQMIGHTSYDEPRFHVTANYLNYFPLDERVIAVGDVHGRLPNGSTLEGPQAEYRRPAPKIRPHAQMMAIARPTVTLIEKDSTGKPAPPTKVVAQTIFVDGDSTNSLIYAGGAVQITREDLTATGDSAFIDQPKETMRLMRNPVINGKKEKPFTLSGDLIDMYSRNKKVERILSRANAKAVSDSMTLTADTIDLRVHNDLLDHAYAWGKTRRATVVSPSQNMLADSLDVSMPGQRIQRVRALRNAYAQGKPDTVRFVVQKPDTTDWLRGDTIFARFDSLPQKDTTKTPPIKQLIASGHASSLYHLAASDSSERRPALNYVTSRLITVNFNDQRVATVTTVDSVVGMYIEPVPDSTKKKAAAANAAANAPAKPGSTPPKKPAVPSVVPLPTKPPTKPPTGP